MVLMRFQGSQVLRAPVSCVRLRSAVVPAGGDVTFSWMAGCLPVWSTGWMARWLVGFLASWLTSWLLIVLSGRLSGWLGGSLAF